MDDRGANIDYVFRNGLKDYEVLPPQDVWENIQPVIIRKQRPLIILRAAAMFAVIVSLSFLAYHFSSELPQNLENPVLSVNPESYSPDLLTADAGTVNDFVLPANTSSGISQLTEEAVNPVTTANIIPEVGNIDNSSGGNELKENRNRKGALPVLEATGQGYVNLYGTNSLDLPDNIIRKEPARWSISALVSPTYQSDIVSGENTAISQALSAEQNVMSYSGGLALSYKINKRFSIQSGLYYSSIGKELTGISAYSGFENYFYTKGSPNFVVLTSSGQVYTSNNDIFLTDALSYDRVQTSYNNNVFDPDKAGLPYLDNSIRQNFSYLELPLILRYKIIDKALDFNLIGGVSSNILVNNAVYADGGNTKIGSTDGMNLLTFSSSFGMGMEYNVSGNLSLNLEPTFRYYLNPFSNLQGIKIHPYSFGIFSGVSYKF